MGNVVYTTCLTKIIAFLHDKKLFLRAAVKVKIGDFSRQIIGFLSFNKMKYQFAGSNTYLMGICANRHLVIYNRQNRGFVKGGFGAYFDNLEYLRHGFLPCFFRGKVHSKLKSPYSSMGRTSTKQRHCQKSHRVK